MTDQERAEKLAFAALERAKAENRFDLADDEEIVHWNSWQPPDTPGIWRIVFGFVRPGWTIDSHFVIEVDLASGTTKVHPAL